MCTSSPTEILTFLHPSSAFSLFPGGVLLQADFLLSEVQALWCLMFLMYCLVITVGSPCIVVFCLCVLKCWAYVAHQVHRGEGKWCLRNGCKHNTNFSQLNTFWPCLLFPSISKGESVWSYEDLVIIIIRYFTKSTFFFK